MPSNTTNALISCRARSAVPSDCHSCCSVTPGRIASIASSGYSLILRCTEKVAMREFRPSMKAVMLVGVRSRWRACSALTLWLRSCTPERQSTWMASIAGSETSSDESTGVPVRCRMPETRNGLSACVASVTAPVPCASTISSPRPTFCARATSHRSPRHTDHQRAAPVQKQARARAITIVLKVAASGTHHPVAAPGIAQRQRHRPLHLRHCGQRLVGLPDTLLVGSPIWNTEYSSRFTGPERAPTIRSVPDTVLAKPSCACVRTLDAQQQHHAEGDDQHGQAHAQRAAAQAGPGKLKHGRHLPG
jgi:hypothetical protein